MVVVVPHCKDTYRNSKQIFPEMKLLGRAPNSYIHVSVNDLYTVFPQSVCLVPIYLFCFRKIGGPIVGIYKSLTDTWIWKLGLRPRSFFSVKYRISYTYVFKTSPEYCRGLFNVVVVCLEEISHWYWYFVYKLSVHWQETKDSGKTITPEAKRRSQKRHKEITIWEKLQQIFYNRNPDLWFYKSTVHWQIFSSFWDDGWNRQLA